jgi:hypothetical protein
MFQGRRVSVVVPAYNEEKLIGKVLAQMPGLVDCVRTRKPPQTDGQNGIRVLRVLTACQRSIERGG